MTAVAVIGGGPVGSALATAWAAAGHDVVVGTREPTGTPAGRWRLLARAEAIARAEVVVDALPGEVAVAELTALREPLAGRTLIDLANPAPCAGDPGSSIAERLQAALPDTPVVKALNTMLAPVMTDPGLVVAPTVFLAGDDAGAKAAAVALLGDLGWRPEWVADVGALRASRVLESFIDLVPALYARHRGAPFALGVSAGPE